MAINETSTKCNTVLITIYFIASFSQAFFYIVNVALLIERIVFFEKPCDIALSYTPYIITHCPLGYTLLLLMLTQFSLAIERLIATIKFEKYERFHSKSFIALFICLTCTIPCLCILWAYQDGDFNHLVISALNPPANVDARLNKAYSTSLVLSMLGLLLVIYTETANKKHERLIGFSTLSGRFQLHENATTTRFISRILVFNLTTNLMYSSGVMVLKNVKFEFLKTNEPLFFTMRSICYLHPMAGFIVSATSIWHVSAKKRQRVKNANNIVMMPQKGKEGFDAYTQILNEQWSMRMNLK
ncbi:unnamed protein product [Caenorhabditis bovis]|uniref:Uncharacterized protein n=1 Tax=Caenorhabditis bovis TaxID=2654633 RepID=A0A8S1F111_9PELO|nr:unnamed protein product [Caenorhabditis bovis]